MLVASDQAPSTFLDFAVFPLSRQKFSNLYEAERALALFLLLICNFFRSIYTLSFDIFFMIFGFFTFGKIFDNGTSFLRSHVARSYGSN